MQSAPRTIQIVRNSISFATVSYTHLDVYKRQGLLIGSILQNSLQVGGIGSVLVNVAAWLSGIWFPLDQIGGGFAAVCKALPFYHAVESVSLVLAGDYGAVLPHLLVLLLYTTLFAAAATFLFYRRMRQ